MASADADCSQKSSSADLLTVGERPTGVELESLLLLKKKGAPPPPAGHEQRATYRVPTSSLLDRVRTFLPRMRESETALQQRVAIDGADSICIEADDSERPHIELNLGLCELDSGSESDSDSDSSEAESDAEESAAPVGPVTAANLRLPGGGGGETRPLVTELGQPRPAAPLGDERLGQ